MVTKKYCPFKLGLKKVFCPWPSVHNVLMFLTVLYVLSLIDLTASEWASWVQALGSIAAICGAFLISKIQADREKKVRLEHERAKAESVMGLLAAGTELSKLFSSFCNLPGSVREFQIFWSLTLRHQLEVALKSLSSIPAYELGSSEFVNCYNGIMAGMDVLHHQAKMISELNPNSPEATNPLVLNGLLMGDMQVQAAWEGYKELHNLKYGLV